MKINPQSVIQSIDDQPIKVDGEDLTLKKVLDIELSRADSNPTRCINILLELKKEEADIKAEDIVFIKDIINKIAEYPNKDGRIFKFTNVVYGRVIEILESK